MTAPDRERPMTDTDVPQPDRPLDGITVIELGAVITGPLASCLLGELGAEVIKIENPAGGDPFRSFLGGLYSPQFRAASSETRPRVRSGRFHSAFARSARSIGSVDSVTTLTPRLANSGKSLCRLQR